VSETNHSERVIKEEELSASNGQEDRPAFVAYEGRVYDVSQSRLWRQGVHVRRHHAGNDLTADFAAAPHDESVFERVPFVGTLPVAEAAEPDEESGLVARLQALLDLYFDLHPHPVAVHFPVALGIVAAVFVALYLLTNNFAFELTGYYVLWGALIMAPVAMLTGAVSWGFNYGLSMDTRFSGKISLSILLVIVEAFAVGLRTANPNALVEREPLGWVYLLSMGVIVVLVAALGWIGAKITFPPRRK
jgi:predicted heme/steroid binding protein/uncharacterized membrane protein